MELSLNIIEHNITFEEKSEDGESIGGRSSIGGVGFDTRRSLSRNDSSLSSEEYFNDEGLDLPYEETYPSKTRLKDDTYLEAIKDSIAQKQNGDLKSVGSAGSESLSESPQIRTSEHYVSVPFGLIPRASYEHGKRSSDIMGVTYNGRMRQFIIIDSKGVTAWKRDAVDHRVTRALQYPKYEYGLITNIIYAKKYNCYFVLGKDFSLKVYNRDFYETCSVSADLRSVLFMLFNPVRDELITGGVGGTKVWRFHQQSGKSYTELKPLANYGLTLKYELPNVGGSWVKRVELDYHLEHLYCCSDTDLHVYDLGGKLLFKFERAHMMSITGCRYSRNASVLVTSSIDCEVKVWSLMGGLVHTFRGHSRAVTNLTLHPYTSSIVITCSLDGSVRMWSLDTMDTLYSLIVSTDGIMWMGLTDDNLLFMSTDRAITLWNLNYNVHYWAMARSNVNKMTLVGCQGKTTRLMAVLDDSSVRLVARSNKKNLCTVLPPPSISPLQRVLSVCYSREFNVIFILINPHEIWVYTTRTDPSCRIAVWDVIGMQAMTSTATGRGHQDGFDASSISANKTTPTHRATEKGAGNEPLANCCCVAILNSTAILWTDEGCGCPIRDSYLLMGLEDGRILFMDPVIKGQKYLEFKTGKDPVLDMYHDVEHASLTTVHKLKDMMQILVWSLPDLELQHEVYASIDLRAYARVGYTLVTGHESGCVIFNQLEITNDPGPNKGRMPPLYEEVIDIHHKPEHLASVIAVDVCISQKIFCSCSNDGAIKIWSEDGVLMTEIMLDSSLTTLCFLNNMGDLLVGFQKQIFIIDHSKVCPQLTAPESDVDGFDKESFICEDPAVLYEGVTPNPDPITLESYLVPFDIEFSKDFLEGRVKLEPEPVKEEESDEESEASMAPTDIYLSPVSTPRSDLSQIDLTLGSEVSKYDLLKQLKKTLLHLEVKERMEAEDMVHQNALNETHRKAQAKKRRKLMKQGLLNSEDFEEGVISNVEEVNVNLEQQGKEIIPKFEFPQFGESPGPTPEHSEPPTPESLSETEDEEVEDEKQGPPPVIMKVEVALKEPDDIAKFLEASSSTDYSLVAKSSKSEIPSTPRKKFGFSGISVDAGSLMGEKKTVVKPPPFQSPRQPAPLAAKKTETVTEKAEVPRKEKVMKKRMSLTGRKLPKLNKIEGLEQKPRPESPPSTQMQALEIKEQKLAVPEKKSQVHKERQNGEIANNTLFEEELNKQKAIESKETELNAALEKERVSVKVSVPSLPSIPLETSTSDRTQVDRNRTAALSANSLGQKSISADNKSSIDFSSLSRTGTGTETLSREITMTSIQDEGNDIIIRGRSEMVTVDSGIHLDRLSMLSGVSDDGQAAFRIGLISKEVTDADSKVYPTSISSQRQTKVETFNKPNIIVGPSRGEPPSAFDFTDSRPLSQGAVSQAFSDVSSLRPISSAELNQSISLTDFSHMQSHEDVERRPVSEESGWVGSDLISVSRMEYQPSGDGDTKEGITEGEDLKIRSDITVIALTLDEVKGQGTNHVDQEDKESTNLDPYNRLRRPRTSLTDRSLGKPQLDDAVKFFRQRPHTAKQRFQTVDLQEAFDSSVERYKSLTKSPLASDKIHRNDDQAFTEDWHERQIERHMLIRMQKELRAQSAKQRRQLLEQRKLERIRQHQEEDHGTQNSKFHPYQNSQCLGPNAPPRSSTVHGTRPSQTGPTPTPVSSRPHTSTGVRERQPYIDIRLFDTNPVPPQQNKQQPFDREQELVHKQRSELSHEKAFRFRLREKEVLEEVDQQTLFDRNPLDLWTIDPRNPNAVRPKSRKSIPSKCHRYVLVSKPKVKLTLPLPSPLEEELLASRFPGQGEKVYKKYEGLLYKPPRRPIYGIEYTPFQTFQTYTN